MYIRYSVNWIQWHVQSVFSPPISHWYRSQFELPRLFLLSLYFFRVRVFCFCIFYKLWIAVRPEPTSVWICASGPIPFGFWLVKMVLFQTNEAIKSIISSRHCASPPLPSFRLSHSKLNMANFSRSKCSSVKLNLFLLYRCSLNKVVEIGFPSAHLRKQLREIITACYTHMSPPSKNYYWVQCGFTAQTHTNWTIYLQFDSQKCDFIGPIESCAVNFSITCPIFNEISHRFPNTPPNTLTHDNMIDGILFAELSAKKLRICHD